MSQANEKRMLTFKGPDREDAYVSMTSEDFSQIQHLHISGEITDGLHQLLHTAKTAGCTVSIEWNGRDMSHLTDTAELNFMNLDEARRLKGISPDTPAVKIGKEIARGLKGVVILTMGTDGVMQISANDDIVRVPVMNPVEPVDRTGGGDAFDAGVIFAFLQGQKTTDYLRSGLETARKALMILGACP
jgi:ribokinase